MYSGETGATGDAQAPSRRGRPRRQRHVLGKDARGIEALALGQDPLLGRGQAPGAQAGQANREGQKTGQQDQRYGQAFRSRVVAHVGENARIMAEGGVDSPGPQSRTE